MTILYSAQLSKGDITFSINDASGTIGTGLDTQKSGLRYEKNDYLNKIGIPFEFFSLKVDSKVYANDNAENYKEAWPPVGSRTNTKNLPTKVFQDDNNIIAVTTKERLFSITHRYTLDKVDLTGNISDKEISIDVTVKNLSSRALGMTYTRGMDMDPPDIDTDNSMGYRNGIIPKKNLVYTISAKNPGKYPLSLYSHDSVTHYGAILAFGKHKEGCKYDPDEIKFKNRKRFSGDGVIYMIFELGTLKAGEEKSFSLSYYLDDNLEALVKRLRAKDPKLQTDKSLISFKMRHHNQLEPKNTALQSIKLFSKNPDYRKTNDKFVIRMSLKKGKMPEGVKIMVGKGSKAQELKSKDVVLDQKFAFDEDIPVFAIYDKQWKDEKSSELKYVLEISKNRSKGSEKFHTNISLEFIPLKNDTIVADIEGEKLKFKVPYGGGREYDKIDSRSFIVNSKANNGKSRTASLVLNEKEKIKGLEYRVNGKNIETNQFTYMLGKPIMLDLYRNNEFSQNSTEHINILFMDIKSKQHFLLPIEIAPLNKGLAMKVEPEHPRVTLGRLKSVSDVKIMLLRDDKTIDPIDEYDLEAECQGINCELIKVPGSNMIQLKIKPSFIEAFTRTGDVPIKLELVGGLYPGDYAQKDFIYTVVDPGWKKWINPLFYLLGILFLLWYLYGVTIGKKRFKKNQVITCAAIHKGKVDRDAERDYHLRKQLPWWNSLIPYRSQRTQVEDLRFIALKNRQVYLSKRSQEFVAHNGLEIDEAGLKDMKLYPGDNLRTDHSLYTIL